jgi:hypothetical protein
MQKKLCHHCCTAHAWCCTFALLPFWQICEIDLQFFLLAKERAVPKSETVIFTFLQLIHFGTSQLQVVIPIVENGFSFGSGVFEGTPRKMV